MNRWLHYGIAAWLLLTSACSTSHMDVVPPGGRAAAPSAAESLIYFVRPSVATSSDGAALIDDEIYIGTLAQRQHLAYVTKPGKHLFVVAANSTDFMEADLAPGKTYYATLRRWAWPKERFSFVPCIEDADILKARAEVQETPQVRPNAKGRRWYQGRSETIHRMRLATFPHWEAKPDQPILPASSGR